ncbi:hypothetical protein V8E53_006793 [Lactarius tabidus]
MVESRGVGIREIEGVLLSTKKITSATLPPERGHVDRREVRALARQILQIETCTFGGVQADEGCGRQRGPKRARMPPAGGKGEGKGAGLGTESSWRRGRSHGKARSILSRLHLRRAYSERERCAERHWKKFLAKRCRGVRNARKVAREALRWSSRIRTTVKKEKDGPLSVWRPRG